jgi:hypothetical protein
MDIYGPGTEHYLDVFERDDPFWNVFRGVLKVVEAAVAQDEPAAFPALPAEKKWGTF